ncbi:hypothetical protein PSCLAVI8L_10024 [Pseudoclavibacter sp. 8L]|nr:hypothetical protein PSCLAVI8L_10024 [Pseudoclavibacter sp. 8L]
MGVDLQTETNLFEDGVRLVATCFLGLLGGLVLELPVIHDLGDGGLRVGGDLDEVELRLLREAQRHLELDYSDLLTARADKADFTGTDAVIGTWFADGRLLTSLNVERRRHTNHAALAACFHPSPPSLRILQQVQFVRTL